MIPAFPRALVRAAESALVRSANDEADPERFMRSAARAVCERARAMLGRGAGADEERAAGARGGARRRSSGAPRVLALAGGGDNGGDALYAASLLADAGVACAVLALHPRLHERGAAAAREAGVEIFEAGALLEAAGIERLAGVPEIDALLDAPVWIDGILGTGLKGVPREPLASRLAELDALRDDRGARVLAIDVPSGALDDEGRVEGPLLRAEETVTMAALKSALVLPPASYAAGAVRVHDLGLESPLEKGEEGTPAVRLVEDPDIVRVVRVPGEGDHKYARGVAGLVAGSDSYPGAGVLACLGAAAAGPGMIRLDAPRRVQDLALSARPGIVTAGGRIQAGLVGPGMDEESEPSVRDLARFCLRSGLPLVVDAGALALVPDFMRDGGGEPAPLPGPVVLTPHAGEASALLAALGDARPRRWIEQNPAEAARALAARVGARVLLKGAACVLASPDGSLVAIPKGTGWTGVAGAGDVLAGILVGLLASWRARVETGREAPSFEEAVAVGALVHARAGALAAGRLGPAGAPIGPEEIAAAVPEVIGAALARLTTREDGAAGPVGY